MKKILALLLALVMAIGLCACGGGETAPAEETETPAAETGTEVASADDIPDTMTSEDGKYEVAFVTDVGQLKDKSFNQGTYDGVKLYAAANDLSYKYYQPANGDQATDDDRYEAMKASPWPTWPASPSRRSSPVTSLATLLSWTVTPSWASAAAAAAPTPLAAGMVMASSRAPTQLLLRRTSRWK